MKDEENIWTYIKGTILFVLAVFALVLIYYVNAV